MSTDNPTPYQDEVRAAILAAGFTRAADFLRSHPHATYRELSEALDTTIAPIYVQLALKALLTDQGDYEYYVRDSFVRLMWQMLPDRWSRSPDTEFQRAHFFGAWSTNLTGKTHATTKALWETARSAPWVPDGWLPDSADDAILLRLLRDTDPHR